MSWLLLPFVGFFVTLYALSIGRGGGLLYVGILTTYAGIQPAAAIATSLAILAPTTIAGALSHWRQGNVSFRLGSILLISGCVGTAAAALATVRFSPTFFKKTVGLIFLWSLINLIYDLYKKRKNAAAVEESLPAHFHTWKPMAYGALAGIISGFSGMSGSTAIMTGLLSCDCPPLEIIGTSLFAIAGISLVGFLLHLQIGTVDWTLTAELCAGSILASVLSPYLLEKIPTQLLKRYFNPVMIFVISLSTIRLLFG